MSKSEGQVLDFEKICRLCLLEKRSMSAIFSKKKSDKKVPLPVRIMSCASLELYEGDGLPASICNKCLLSVNQSYAFREQCEQADTTLRQYAQRMNETSEETPANRVSGESIANVSLGHVEDKGNKSEEGNDGVGGGDDKDLERSEKADSRICHESEAECDFGNLVISSLENVNNSTSCLYEIDIKQFNSGKKEVCLREGQRSKRMGNNIRNLEIDETSKQCNDNVFQSKVDENLEWTMKKVAKKLDEKISLTLDDIAKESTFDSPVLRALSTEKAENVVVVADVDTINAKYPSDIEDGDGDLGEIALTSSEDEESLKKMQRSNWFRQGFRIKKGPLISEPHKSVRRRTYKEKSKKCNFENQRHLELLQNLMKNKNIIVKKRGALGSSEPLSVTNSVAESQEFSDKFKCKSNVTFPYDFRIAQLWKEWDEVNKRLSQISKNVSQSQMEKPTTDNANNDAVTVKSGEKADESFKKSPDSLEVVVDQTKSNEDTKTKWKNGKDTVYCKDCGIFLLRSSYNNHIKFVHQKVRKFLCQTCGYAACTGTILRQHVQAVHVGYSFSCDQCSKKFNLMKRLRKHIEMHHSGKPVERNHICQYCGMAFAKPGCLKRHLRSHTQETPYQCQYCQRRFKYRWPKVQHERLHTGEKPYKCSFCEERFTQNCVRKAHEYKKHGNEEFKPKNRTRKEGNATSQLPKAEKENSEESPRGSFRSGSESS